MNVETVTAIIAALGGPVLIVKIIDVVKAHRNGKAAREKAENRSALGRLADAEEERDREADFRRRVEEWAGGIIYAVVQWGYPADRIPPKPARRSKVGA